MWIELLEPKSFRAAPGDRNRPLVDPGDSEDCEEADPDADVGDSVAELLRCSKAPGGFKALVISGTGTVNDSMDGGLDRSRSCS